MKVLMFTVSAGNGHNSTAKRIKEKLLEKDPSTEIEIVDVYKTYASKLKAWIMEEGYFLACNHFVGLYNHFFKKSEKSDYENRYKAKVNNEVNPLLYGMIKKIYDYKPDVIISTYIFCSVALTNLRRYYTIPAKIICMTLDYGISPYWECTAEGLDYMFLTDEYMVKPFKQKGFKDSQLIVSGIPVSEKFAKLPEREKSQELLGLDKNMFTLLIMKASFFPISNQNIVNELAKINKPIQVVIVNGKDEKCKNDIGNRLSNANLNHNIINIGFTDKIVEYFSATDLILGKAGGLSTTESINSGIPSLIVDKLPQQEIYNKEFLISHNCALAVTKNTIGDTINKLINNKDKYNKLKSNAIRIRKPNALTKFYEIISKCPNADYSNIEFNDTKRKVIRNVKLARLNAMKNNK